MINIINIVDSGEKLNFGVWNASIATAKELRKLGFKSEIWIPKPTGEDIIEENGFVKHFIESKSLLYLKKLITIKNLSPHDTIICSHGTWFYQTRWAFLLKKLGFKWVIVPQGMLEPWQVRTKWFKKYIYFNLVEKNLIKKADIIRAVSSPEKSNLKKLFKNSHIDLIPNATKTFENIKFEKPKNPKSLLFMGRLHHKKGIKQLVEGWLRSDLNNDSAFLLEIAGPDQGELGKINNLIESSKNIRYYGPVYGSEKVKLLKKASYFVLPSHSEGFPSSIIEAMSFGAVSLISSGCNFPEAIDAKVSIEIDTTSDVIKDKLNLLFKMSDEEYRSLQQLSLDFIRKNYDLKIISNQLSELYKKLLS